MDMAPQKKRKDVLPADSGKTTLPNRILHENHVQRSD